MHNRCDRIFHITSVGVCITGKTLSGSGEMTAVISSYNSRGRMHNMSVTVFDAYVVSDLVKETVPTSTLPFSTGADLEVGSD